MSAQTIAQWSLAALFAVALLAYGVQRIYRVCFPHRFATMVSASQWAHGMKALPTSSTLKTRIRDNGPRETWDDNKQQWVRETAPTWKDKPKPYPAQAKRTRRHVVLPKSAQAQIEELERLK